MKMASNLVIVIVSLMTLAAIGVAQDAPVDPKCFACSCPRVRSPVCGSDGVTYSNDCMLECARKNCKPDLRFTHCGKCGSTPAKFCLRHQSNP